MYMFISHYFNWPRTAALMWELVFVSLFLSSRSSLSSLALRPPAITLSLLVLSACLALALEHREII